MKPSTLGWWLMVGLVIMSAGFGLCREVHADVITEFGMVWKLPNTSVVALPTCHVVRPVGEAYSNPEDPHFGRTEASCGGDNPMFVGWPVAWQKEFDGPWAVRAGWFHLSHWFDGGEDREIHIDAAGAVVTFNWGKRRGVER